MDEKDNHGGVLWSVLLAAIVLAVGLLLMAVSVIVLSGLGFLITP